MSSLQDAAIQQFVAVGCFAQGEHRDTRQLAGELEKALVGAVEPLLSALNNDSAEMLEGSQLVCAMLDQKRSRSGRRLYSRVGYRIEHGLVALMTYAYDDGEGHLRHSGCQRISVEIGEVAGGTAATDDDNAVPLLGFIGNGCQGGHDALLDMGALHHSWEQLAVEKEAVVVVEELMLKIAIARGTRRGYDCHTLEESRQRQLLVVMEDAVGLQLVQYLAAPQGHLTKRECRVYLLYVEGIAVHLVKLNADEHAHLQAGTQALSSGALEERCLQRVGTGPHRAAGTGYKLTPRGIALCKLHVEMAVGGQSCLGKLSLQPIGIGERLLKCFTHKLIKFKKGQGLHDE